ncbi:MAG TPA: N-acetylmuramoyl-L-alanine amidase [Kiritimatiellia bacterium]|nr:N-acetylmuramoyl-L-alanine amidase [Kiritimatiellia bacterium]
MKRKSRNMTGGLILAAMLALPAALMASAIARPQVQTFALGSERYAQLRDVARFYNLDLQSARGSRIPMKSKWTDLQLEASSRKMWMNGMLIWLHMPTVKSRLQWALSKEDMDSTLDPLLRPNLHLRSQGSRIVVLDPGHGGVDRGARGARGLEEKKVVMDIAERARAHLANAGIKVYLTRSGDRALSLSERNFRANQWNADVFVSIHLNASTTAGASGVETYVLAAPGYPSTNAKVGSTAARVSYRGNARNGANMILGYMLQKNLLLKTKAEDRGLRRARFAVLKDINCAAALVECGFLSNAREEWLLRTDDYLDKIAQAVAQGIIEYLGTVERAKVSMP